MNRLEITISDASVVVGLDFGTTFSGFAYALASKPEECHLFFEWPGLKESGATNYCKTQTSLLYSNPGTGGSSSGSFVLEGWGHEALVQHATKSHARKEECSARNRHTARHLLHANPVQFLHAHAVSEGQAHFITRFKLHLAGTGKTSAADLPKGLTARRAISDYLRKLSDLIISVLQKNLGSHISKEDVQWCITVPAIWDETAKQEMKTCAEVAGLVQGPNCREMDASPHPAIIVLEPEAASFYCQRISDFPLSDGDKFLVVDAGGGTVDLALHQKVGSEWSNKVRQVAPSSGGLCGGTYVDEGFSKFLTQRISCYREFAAAHPQSVLKLQSWWDTIKCNFNGDMLFDYETELSVKLARAWEEDETSKGRRPNADVSYDTIALTLEDMLSIFDPVVNQILDLIDCQWIPDLKAIMVVGGFAASPYLTKRIKEAYSQRLAAGKIIFPKDPGSAICCGAVAFGVGSDLVMSRISKKTYGIAASRLFRQGDPLHMKFVDGDGATRCRGTFTLFTRKGETVLVDCSVSHRFSPGFRNQTETRISLYSTTNPDPEYVTEPGIYKEDSFVVKHPSRNVLGEWPDIEVSMYFGRTTIEVKAVGKNFGGGEEFVMPPVTFERYIRLIVAESLRLYPQPPLLIRRALEPDTIPGGYNGDPTGYPLPKGADVFISVYNIHRSPYFWNEPEKFNPERFLEPKPSEIDGWAGYDPAGSLGAFYPNEVISDFAFLPFGGGARKCVGDQFALMEVTIALTLLLQRFDLELKGNPEDVKLVTGATKAGLWCKLRKRSAVAAGTV